MLLSLNSSATACSTTAPLKKPGLLRVCSIAALVNVNSRKSCSVTKPFSTISNASGITSRKSGTSKCVKSDLNTGRRRKPMRRSMAHRTVISLAPATHGSTKNRKSSHLNGCINDAPICEFRKTSLNATRHYVFIEVRGFLF